MDRPTASNWAALSQSRRRAPTLIFSARVTDKAKVDIDARNVGRDRWTARTTESPGLLFSSLLRSADGEWWPDDIAAH